MGHFSSTRLLFSLALLLPALPAQGFQDDKKQTPEEKKAQEDAGKKAVDEFNDKLKDAKSLPEKAILILNFGDVEPKDKCMVSAVAKYLNPTPADMNFILVTAAADALGKFKGMAQASAVLSGALAGFKKNPYVSAKISTAVGKVGHESALPAYEEAFKGIDVELAAQSVWVIAEFPPVVAVDAYFREHDRIEKDKEKKKANLKDEVKKVYDRVEAEMLKAMKKITKQNWLDLKGIRHLVYVAPRQG